MTNKWTSSYKENQVYKNNIALYQPISNTRNEKNERAYIAQDTEVSCFLDLT